MTRFIDAHVHPPVASFLEGPIAAFLDDLQAHVDEEIVAQTADELTAFYRSRDAKAVLLGWNSRTKSGLRSLGNKEISALVEHAPEAVSYTHLRAHETNCNISYAVFCLKKGGK